MRVAHARVPSPQVPVRTCHRRSRPALRAAALLVEVVHLVDVDEHRAVLQSRRQVVGQPADARGARSVGLVARVPVTIL